MSQLKEVKWTVGGKRVSKKVIFYILHIIFSVTAAASDEETVGSAFVRLNLGKRPTSHQSGELI